MRKFSVTTFYIFTVLFMFLFLFSPIEAATQIDISGPAGSERFGTNAVALPNGNIVIVDPEFDAPGPLPNAGAVFLYNGATGALISTLTGNTANDNIGEVIVLSNGNFVVLSKKWQNGAGFYTGAVTFCNGSSGCSGTISAANSLVGSTAGDMYYTSIHPLPNGNYVVFSPGWSNGGNTFVGATTFCSGVTGCTTGVISDMNSLVGSKAGNSSDQSKLTILTNGNYVFTNSKWDNATTANAGAVTFCSGTTGCAPGVISGANSLIGGQSGDEVGSDGVTPLSNGNYVVRSSIWANDSSKYAGAATLCSGTTGCNGTVTAANSLVGTAVGDQVGISGVTELANGNYVVSSEDWDLEHYENTQWNSGAVTLCSGVTGCVGAVSPQNSLVGFAYTDHVGSGGIVALPNGNYLVHSPNAGLANTYAGGVTFCSGTTGCTGLISPTNTLHGVRPIDMVGILPATILPSGDYVVPSPYWDGTAQNDVNLGAVTWCSGATGCSGPVTAANSLTGSTPSDQIGNRQITVLPSGNYLVRSPDWDNVAMTDAGAVTFCSGASGCTGAISIANSLIGSSTDDRVGSDSLMVLTTGNYIVPAAYWDNGTIIDAGAVTLCSGTTGCVGEISPAGSLTGTKSGDKVGTGVAALTNGNYVVASPHWDNGAVADAGAVTWCSGSTGCDSAISPSNSLVGTSMSDLIGYSGVTALANGNYMVRSAEFNNNGINRAGAITLGPGNAPLTGAVSFSNSVRGNTAVMGFVMNFTYDAVNERLVVGRPDDNTVSLFRPTYTAIASGNWSAASTWDYGSFEQPQNIHIRGPHNVTLDTNIVADGVSIFPAGGLTLSGDRSSASGIVVTGGTLDLNNNNLDMGDNQLTLTCTIQPSTLLANANGFIIGRLQRCRPAGVTTMKFPVGTANGYSPVILTNVSGGGNATFRVKAVQGAYSNQANGLPVNRLRRWWELTNGGLTRVDVQFNYQASDVAGSESNYRVYKIDGGMATQQTATIDATSHTATVFGVTGFSDWTLADVNPSAAAVNVGGRVMTAEGAGISKATVKLTDNTGITRTVLTNGFGYYQFEKVDVGKTYVFSILSKQHQFAPQIITVNEDVNNLNFAAISSQKRRRLEGNGVADEVGFALK